MEACNCGSRWYHHTICKLPPVDPSLSLSRTNRLEDAIFRDFSMQHSGSSKWLLLYL